MSNEIYLDANATSPVLPAAADAALEAMRAGFGNPSSTHATGLRARALLDGVRACARRVLGAGEGLVVFTSGATEGIQASILSALCAVRDGRVAGKLLLYGATEHKAVPEALAHWNRILGTGLELRALPVGADGRHDLAALRELAPQAALVCTMAANNETGVVSDLAGIEAVLDDVAPRALWMVDGVQALGKIKLELARTRIDYAPFSGHKLYAPKGIGMLYVRRGAPFTPLMMGGGQEGGCRSGTENMAGIAALGAVLAALERGDTFLAHGAMAALRDRLALALRDALPGVVFNTPFEHALPTTLNFSVPGLASRDLLELFDAAGLRVSSGSACSSAKAAPSHVLEAMGLPCWRSASAVRLSFGPATDPALIDAACDRLLHCGEVLRARAAAAELPAVTQVSADGVSAWIVADARARQCVVIDRVPALAERIDACVRGYTVRAELATSGAASWPEQHELVALANRAAPALVLGELALVRWAAGGSVAYLAGRASGAALAAGDVDFVFVRRAADAGALAGVADQYAVVCCAADEHSVPFTTVGAEAGGPARVPAMDGLMHVAPPALERFLETHPGAIVVDVREPHERMAGPPPAWRGADTLHVPMSQLASWLPQWLRSGQPALVFFCRSGNRSARAALMLHRLGYRNAWSLSGGLALNTALAA